eukprot:EG_transcript_43845
MGCAPLALLALLMAFLPGSLSDEAPRGLGGNRTSHWRNLSSARSVAPPIASLPRAARSNGTRPGNLTRPAPVGWPDICVIVLFRAVGKTARAAANGPKAPPSHGCMGQKENEWHVAPSRGGQLT